MLAVTEPTRHALQVARDRAEAMGADYVDTGDLLLGVLAERDGIATRALSNLGLHAEAVSTQLTELPEVREERAARASALSQPAKMAIECSLREARVLGCSHAEPHHVVLGLLRAAQTYPGALCAFGSVLGFEERLRIRNEILQLSPRAPQRA